MLATFRRSLNTWPARLLFMLLVAAFAMWGIGDVVRNIARDSAPVRVAGQRIDLPVLQQAFQRNMNEATRRLGNTDPTPQIRQAVAMQTVQQLVTQTALDAEARRLGLAVPDDAVRRAVFAMPAFHGKDGAFDHTLMVSVLRNNGLNEPHFIQLMRDQLLQQQMLQAVSAGAVVPAEMARQVYQYEHEKRVADAVMVPFAAAAAPPAPTDTALQRWWANHPDRYSTPEYRRIKAIVLSPQSVAKDVQVTDDDLRAQWAQDKSQYNTPERRSVAVILTQDAAEAERLAEQWRGGADWAQMQDAADKAGAAPVPLDDATRSEFPAPELGDAVFATPEGTVPPPVHSALGWHVFKVTKVTPGRAMTFEEAKPLLRDKVVAQKAADLIYDRANRIDNLLSSGSSLETLPGDAGVAAVSGTLDVRGDTPEGKPAPIPGSEALRKALVAAAFQARPGDAPKLTQVPGEQAFFAVSVDGITPPKPRPFDQVAEQVRADWTTWRQRHEQETIAAKLLTAVKGGKPLAEAAAAAGLKLAALPPAGRDSPTAGVPPQLVAPLFHMKPGEPTMIETPEGFVVATLAKVEDPDPAGDPIGFDAVRSALASAVGQDMQQVFAGAVRDRSNAHINPAVIQQLAGADE